MLLYNIMYKYEKLNRTDYKMSCKGCGIFIKTIDPQFLKLRNIGMSELLNCYCDKCTHEILEKWKNENK